MYTLVYRDTTGVVSQAIAVPASHVYSGLGGDVLYWLPNMFDGSIDKAEVYRGGMFLGFLKPEDEGVFDTAGKTSGQTFVPSRETFENYESHFRWSEPYQPQMIRPDATQAVAYGDGDQITGMAVLYGNLIVFKENSVWRFHVQGKPPVPIQRTDNISPDIGCIAPNTCITISNKLYFLSWRGFMQYDGNVLSRLDGAFNEELQYRLRASRDVDIRESSCAYNAIHNEIYLNVPVDELSEFQERTRKIRGHIYVVSLDRGYVTKFAYDTFNAGNADDQQWRARLYNTNSRGELFSAATRPNPLSDPREAPMAWNESTSYALMGEADDAYPSATGEAIRTQLIYAAADTKFFQAQDETLVKRVREAVVNLFAKNSPVVITLDSVALNNQDDRIDNESLQTVKVFDRTEDAEQATLFVVPDNDRTTNPFEDRHGKPTRFGMTIETRGYAQISQIAFHVRPIQRYLA